MNRLGLFLALFFGLLLCASSVFGRGSLATWPHPAPHPIAGAAADACTLDVVLVTFQDATGSTTNPAHQNSYDYHDDDRPWGEVGQGANRRLTAASYRRHDFLRMLAGGYDVGGHPTPFVGNTVTVATDHQLPEVFGSVRAYFEAASNGAFHLHVRMVNPPAAGTDDLARWIELPRTKEYYAELLDNRTNQDIFWDDAYDATLNSLSLPDPAWENVRMRISLPHRDSTATYPYTRLLRRKILFLYSGVVFTPDVATTAGFQHGLLHPQVDRVTLEDPTPPIWNPNAPTVGYRYVMGERQGFGNNGHGIDEFAGIGMHAHEIGHLLGLTHGWGYWQDNPNRYSGAPQYTNAQGANQLGWTLMQGGGDQGPVMRGAPYNPDGYYTAYRSCPNPINPFYLMDLGWLTPDEITRNHNDYPIAPGETYLIERNAIGGSVEFLLNRRTLEPFGGRYVSFYDYDTRNDAEQGLMIWRRYNDLHPHWEEHSMLIVADERRYRDARDQVQHPNIDEYYDMLSDPFAAGEIADPRGGTAFDQANVDSVHSLNAGEGLRQETLGEEHRITRIRDGQGYHPDPGDVNLALTDIREVGDNIFVDVALARPQAPTNLTAEVRDGQVTLRWDASTDPTRFVPSIDPTVTAYQYQYDGVAPPIRIVANPTVADSIEVIIPGLINDMPYTFEVSAVNGLGLGPVATLTATPQELGPSAVDDFAEDVTPDEDDTPAVATYEATGLGDAPEWWLEYEEDDTRDAFELRGTEDTGSTRTLHFRQPPNFETPNATEPQPVYPVTIRVRAGPVTVMQAVVVTVRNVDEAGTVSLEPLPPEAGEELTATLEDDDGIVSVDGWTWQRAASATAEEEDWTIIAETDGGEPTNHYTPQLSDVGWVLQATAYYADGHGPNKSEVSAPTAAVIGPELVGPERLTFVEHGTFVEDGKAVVPTYTVSGVDGTATWSLDGTDAGAFDLAAASSQASLSFSQPPNFEKPTDTDKGGPNTYHVTIVATLTAAAETAEEPLADLFAAFQNLSDDTESAQASSAALTQAVVVTVENGDDPGVVELLPAGPPRVGHSLTARLVDEDEDLTDMVWTWLADGDVVRPASPSGETTDGYEPQPEDEGRALQTQVRYKDPFGAKTVVSAPTAAVLPAGVVSLSPNPPRLCQPVTAELSGPEEVTGETWTWERQRQGSDKWDLLWSSSSPDKTASDSDLAYLFSAYNRGSGKVSRYQPTEEDLDRVLRATVSWDGHEASDRAPVGASAPGLPRHLEGEGRAAKVVLSWRTPNNCGSAITGYEYQYRRYGATAWEQAWTPIDGSAATTSHTVDGLELGALYTLEVRAVNDEGEGAAARTQATAECPPPVIAGPPTLSVSENRVVQLARYTVEDTRCGQPNWSLAGPDARHFSLFQRKLTLKRGLNYEQPQDANLDNHYQLQVVAHDKHDPSEEDSLDVEVEVTDVNEPLVLYGAGSLAIPENWTGEITTYTAADPEGATVYWKLKGPDASLFRLAISSSPSATAYLHLDRSLNFESPISADRNNAYQLYIEASDGLHTDTIQVFVRVRLVTVRVTDVNERPWVQGPSRRSFAENDTGFVSSFYANDPEGDSLGWSLGGAAGHFRINGIGRSSSRLHVVQPMDYEAVLEDADGERAYGLDVQASDGSLSGSMRTKVVVLDVNEPPELEGPSGAAVDENSRAVADYRATDPERTNITWSLSGPNATAFRLSGSGSSGSGSSRSLYFYQAPDYELDPRSYAVSITAQDATGLSATLAVSVSVLDDVNESSSPPIDLPGEDPGSVSLNPLQPREGEPVTATLRDPDGDITDTQWTWQSGGTTVSTTDSYEPMAGDVGQVLQVQVSYQDGEGSNTDQASATSAAVLGATEQASCVVQAVEGSSTVSHPEGGTESVASYTARVSDSCGALSWSLSGSDAGSFQLRGSTLYFNTGPAVGSYAVTITAEDDASGASAALPVSVTVVADDPGDPDDPTPCNPNQLGSIDLTTTQPQVGQPITAILTDPDGGVRNVRWGWRYFSNTLSNQVAAAEDYPELDSFTPSVVLEGIRLQATALYDDACLNNQRAKSVKTDPVQPAAGKPVVRRAPPPVSKLTALAAPNPFNPHTSLHLALPGRGRVELTVYNMAGQIVRTVVDGSLEAGYHTVHWDGRDQQDRPVTSGVYLYRVRTDPQVVVGKMALIR